MASNRFLHKRTRARYSSDKSAKMNKARWDAVRARQEADMPERLREMAEWDMQNLPRKTGDALGCLQWTDFATGKVLRWTARIGGRIDQITLHSPDGRKTLSHGWSWAMDHLRGFLAGRK